MERATFTLQADIDTTPVRGNASASGDPAVDLQVEQEIFDRLRDGDCWAWALVKVKASYRGWEGVATLGGCTYASEQDFLESGGMQPLRVEAAEALERELEASGADIDEVDHETVIEGQYAVVSITPGGNLEIRPTKEFFEDIVEIIPKTQPDRLLWECLEDFICNGRLEWINPEEIGAMTEAPILALAEEVDRGEDGVLKSVERVFWHEPYMIESAVEVMRDSGVVKFSRNKSFE